MRIAQVANFVAPGSGGMRTALDALGAGYAASGVERLLVVPGPRDATLETAHGPVVQIRGPRFGDVYRMILSPWRVHEVLERFAPHSVELHDKTTLLPVARWARARDIPAVLFSHERLTDMLPDRTQRTGAKLSATIVNHVAARAVDAVVVTSRFAAQEFTETGASTPVHLVPLGVDLDQFRPCAPSSDSDGRLRLVHVGRLSREKSPDLAVRTALELHHRGVRLRLDLFGDGPMRVDLELLAADGPIHFHGRIDDRAELARRIGQADVALSVCPTETFGLAALEALACGTPVVTASTGGASESVCRASGDRGLPFPSSLADAVMRVAGRDPGTRRLAARRRAEQFPWSLTVERLLAVHDRVAVRSRQLIG